MHVAVPAVPIMKDQVGGSGRRETHAHDLRDAGSGTDDRAWIERLDDGSDRKEVELRSREQRRVGRERQRVIGAGAGRTSHDAGMLVNARARR